MDKAQGIFPNIGGLVPDRCFGHCGVSRADGIKGCTERGFGVRKKPGTPKQQDSVISVHFTMFTLFSHIRWILLSPSPAWTPCQFKHCKPLKKFFIAFSYGKFKEYTKVDKKVE